MNPSTARKMVPAAMVVTSIAVGVAFFGGKPKAGEGFKVAWSLGALYLILSLGVDIAPEVAGPLALLIMLGVAIAPKSIFAKVLHLDGAGSGQNPPPGGEPPPTPPPVPPVVGGTSA